MSFDIQILLIILGVITYWFIIRKIRNSNAKVEDMIIWILGSLMIILLGLFPKIPIYISNLLGFISPSNFIFLSFIGLFYIMLFLLTIRVSSLQQQNEELAQRLALYMKEQDEKE